MTVMYGAGRRVAIAIFVLSITGPVDAATFNLPLNGTGSIVGDLPTSYNPSSFGPVEIGIQAFQNFSGPVFNPQNPATTVGIYQWIATFSVLNQSGTPIPEPGLSPFGTALTGYGQNCSVSPFCPSPSGSSSETILSGDLFISDAIRTVTISTTVFTQNILNSELELQVTLPDGVSITPLPAALPLFATGFGALAFAGYRRKRKSHP
jgi:hypothetical protein